MNLETIVFENNTLKIINQVKLPESFTYIELSNLDDIINSIHNLQVRGAPAIGIVAAYGFFIHVQNLFDSNNFSTDKVTDAANILKKTRPTAVNLQWAVDKMLDTFSKSQSRSNADVLEHLKTAAQRIHQDDKESCKSIGELGSELISDSANILTHCNAGILATGGMGTALAPIYVAHQKGKNVHVYVDETRPIGQGARLTYWELHQNKVPATLITDNMAASLMQLKKIDLIIVGADRIARNGDVANKIGTYGLAVLANYHNIPFYVAAPISTYDNNIVCGNDIPIEERSPNEILDIWKMNYPENYKTYNPAFDITPNDLISAIITEKSIIKKPVKNNIKSII